MRGRWRNRNIKLIRNKLIGRFRTDPQYPEYNLSYPGHLKNLIDWLSRPVKPMDYETPTCINGKRVALSGAGGRFATAKCREKLTELLTFVKAEVLPGQVGIAVPGEAWTSDVLTLTDEQKAQLMAQAEDVIK
jgi:NAD(P)H-dependent FMN reductase